jgi:hypothetical protein
LIVLSEIYYKKQPLDIDRFRSLVLAKMKEHNIDPHNPIAPTYLKNNLGLFQPIKLLANVYGSQEKVMHAAGFTTYWQTKYANDEERLRAGLLKYCGGSKNKLINVRQMHLDYKNGGSSLASALSKFAKKNFGKRTASLAIDYFKHKTVRPHRKPDEIGKVLLAFWPESAVQAAYAGERELNSLGSLNEINGAIYHALFRRNAEKFINSLYKDCPDLYSVVSPDGRADPEVVRKQLLQRFNSGQSISSGIQNSQFLIDRVLYRRVMSLQPLFFDSRFDKNVYGYTQIVRQLLPELNVRDIRGNAPDAIRRNGAIGELFTEWMLKWTLAIDPSAGFYHDGFSRIFNAPLSQVHREKNVETDDGIKRPDILTIGRKNTAVEIKTGEDRKRVLELAGKYPGEYSLNLGGVVYPLDNRVAVLHMPERTVREVSSELLASNFVVIGAEQFLGYLETFVDKISQSPWQEHFENAAQRISDPRQLIGFYKEFASKPSLMARSSRAEEAAFVRQSLENLVDAELLPAQGI